MSDSPETFSRTRRNATAPPCGAVSAWASALTGSASQSHALERNHRGAGLAEHLADRLGRLAAPRLVEEDATRCLREEALREHALDDLVPGLLRLARELVG